MTSPLKICFFTPSYPPMVGGVSNSAERVSRLLSANYEVHVVTIEYANDIKLLDDNWKTTKESSHYYVHRLSLSSYQNIDNTGVGIAPTSQFTRQRKELYISLRPFIEREKFNFIHLFFLDYISFSVALIANELKVPMISSIRGNDIGKSIFDNYSRPSQEYILNHSSYVTSVAQDLLISARAISPIEAKSCVILNSIDCQKFLAKSKGTFSIVDKRSRFELVKLKIKNHLYQQKTEPLLMIGTVGILKFKKGLDYLLKAFWLLPDEQKEKARLVIVGRFYSKADELIFKKWIRTYNIDRYVHHVIPSDEFSTADYYRSFDIFVQSSLYSEGCPNTLLEAMCIPLPIVATRAGAIPQIIDHDQSGILCDQANAQQLSEGISRLMNGPQKRRELASGAVQKLKELTPEKELKDWLDVYSKV